ncbi:MAG: hypothetical protein C5B48_03585 [Candidatus Rokuibacteriota bacterium]|nr:MAG: hypothetical protein C5B48_03585 [Candidatus Rokubacteria bacterium]
MSLQAIAGLLVLNLFVLGAGAGVLWGLRGWRSWTELLRLSGAAYMLGLASLFVLWTLELVVGVPFGTVTIVSTGGLLVLGGVLTGRRKGRSLPRFRHTGWRVPRLSVLGALFVAGIAVYFEALFRSARLQGMGDDWDAWRAWTLRAKGLYYFGHLDVHMPSLGQYPSYPPGVSALQAAAFHAMGSADVVTLHLQYWFLAVGFVGALAGLLGPRVRTMLLLPFLLLMLVMPGVTAWNVWLMADLPLGYFVAVGAVLVALWIEEQREWHLAGATLLLAAAMLTKREGLLYAACVVVAGLAATWGQRSRAWPRLGGVAAVAFALALPWRIWFTAHGLHGDGPESGWLGSLGHLQRVWPSFELVVRTMFAYGFWLVVPALAVVAASLGILTGARRLGLFLGAFLGAALVGATWVIWSNPSYPFTQDYSTNPVGRLTGTCVLTLAALTPLLLQRAWHATQPETGWWTAARLPDRWATGLAAAIVLVALLGYPSSRLVGSSGLELAGALPSFPSAGKCSGSPSSDRGMLVVLGDVPTYAEAYALRARARAAGIRETSVVRSCGLVRVSVAGVPSAAVLRRVERRAAAAGLRPVRNLEARVP